jgi:hypothetical protein
MASYADVQDLLVTFRVDGREEPLSTWHLKSDRDTLHLDNGLFVRTHGMTGHVLTFTIYKAFKSFAVADYVKNLRAPLVNTLKMREIEYDTLLQDVAVLTSRVVEPSASEEEVQDGAEEFKRLTSCARNHIIEINKLKAKLEKLPVIDEHKPIAAHLGQTFTAELGRMHHFTFEEREVWLLIEDHAAPTTVCKPAVLNPTFVQQQLHDLGYGHDELLQKELFEGPDTWREIDSDAEESVPHPEEPLSSVAVANWQDGCDEPAAKRKR